jgi:hypothetical protein
MPPDMINRILIPGNLFYSHRPSVGENVLHIYRIH